MIKRDNTIYWVATIWLSLGMLSGGVFQLLRMEDSLKVFIQLGYPVYFLSILGIWKILGVVAILLPKFPLLKEWACAGFFFAITGAIVSHIAMNDPLGEIFSSTFTLVLVIVSWYFMPENRKIVITIPHEYIESKS
jgi:DoxX-like family